MDEAEEAGPEGRQGEAGRQESLQGLGWLASWLAGSAGKVQLE